MTLTASELATEKPDARAKFEAWFRWSRSNKGKSRLASMFEKLEDGTYLSDSVQRHWWTWQSALASQSEEQGKDAGRMDWCQKHLVQVNQDLNELFAVTYLDSDEWEQRTGRFTTLREAVDAAMATPKEGALCLPSGPDTGK